MKKLFFLPAIVAFIFSASVCEVAGAHSADTSAGPRDTYIPGKKKSGYSNKNTWSPSEPSGNTYVPEEGIIMEETPEVTVGEVASPSSLDNLQWPQYENWDKATIQGKLKMQGLPLSPSLKIFMQKDSLIDVSVRAPLVGEAARILLTRDSVLLVNNLKKVFTREALPSYSRLTGGFGISDIQNLLLARLFVVGYDWNYIEAPNYLDVFDNAGTGFILAPKDWVKLPEINYGFTTDTLFRPLMMMALPANNPDVELDALFNYHGADYDITLDFKDPGRLGNIQATLELKKPSFAGEAPKDKDLGKKYRQVSLNEFLRSF